MAIIQRFKLFNNTGIKNDTIFNLMLKPMVQEPELIKAFRNSGFCSCMKKDIVEPNTLSDNFNFHAYVSYKIFLDDKPCKGCSHSKAQSVGAFSCDAAKKVEFLVHESIMAENVSILHDFCRHKRLCRLIKNIAPLCIAR
ncbi:MAG: hypothetical protein LBB08_01875 [Rickettsiales bacterium]|jgi:hypothetical protein|nr:hypothetical protein [Rickettsiales bacterium]